MNNEQKQLNKYYSTSNELIKYIDFTSIIRNNTIILEPYCGDYDLLNQFKSIIQNRTILAYDIVNPTITTKDYTDLTFTKQDTIINNVITDYNTFIITNPPYTSKNKLTTELKNKYNKLFVDSSIQDLYQIFIQQLIDKPIIGGFIIIPSNFIFGIKTKPQYNKFISIYNINVLNIFEKKVFEHTTQSVVSIQFTNKNENINSFKCTLFRNGFDSNRCDDCNVEYTNNDNKNNEINITQDKFDFITKFNFNRYYNCSSKISVKRYYNIDNKVYHPTNIVISLLDYNMKAYFDNNKEDKQTDRAFMRIRLNTKLTTEQENSIFRTFNNELIKLRNMTNSLVLTSYREFDRKRLKFEEVYVMIRYVIDKLKININ